MVAIVKIRMQNMDRKDIEAYQKSYEEIDIF